jgi:pimeloyl-ACP methyl ester carboxylesterase
MTVQAADGLILKGLLAYPEIGPGKGFPLAVLAHQYPATADSYAPLVEDLIDLGVATLAFDLRGHGASIQGTHGRLVIDTPVGFTMDAFGLAFVGSAGKVGFKHINDDIIRVASWGAVQNFIDAGRLILVGSSVSGTGAVLAALITFGAAGEPVWGDDGRAQARKAMELHKAPSLLATSEKDPFDGAGNVKAWSEGLRHVKPLLVPGAAHGMAIYYDVRDQVLEFVKGLKIAD